jgi:PhzF family phenazine biosynthesis protein
LLSGVRWSQQKHNVAFLTPIDAANGEYRLRWFTPTVEVILCGHATLASAHALFTEAKVSCAQLRFHTLSGVITVTRTATGLLRMEFPAGAPIDVGDKFDSDLRKQLCDALKLEGGATSVVNLAHCGKTRKLLLETNSLANVRGVAPSGTSLLAITWPPHLDIRGVIVTARTPDTEFDFQSRYFAPWVSDHANRRTSHARVVNRLALTRTR